MPEGRRSCAEDSAGLTVVPESDLSDELFHLVLVDDGSAPRQLGPCPHEVEPFPWEGSELAKRDRAERLLLGSVRIFRSLNR